MSWAGPFQQVLVLGVLELGEVERGGVRHDAHADAVGEEVAKEAFDEDLPAGDQLGEDNNADFQAHQLPDVRPVGVMRGEGCVDLIDDVAADPELGDRGERPDRPQEQHRRRERAAGLPNQAGELEDVAKGGEAVAPPGLVRRVGLGWHELGERDRGGRVGRGELSRRHTA
jgi:hypothetical protein